MLKIGCHLSISEGLFNAANVAFGIGANTFQFFTRNPRGLKSAKFEKEDIEKFLEFSKLNNFSKLIAHAPYTMNLCSAKSDIRRFSLEILKDDLKKMSQIPGNFYNLHPGNHSGQGVEIGIEFIAESLSIAVSEDSNTTVLIETMAGKGSEIGSNFGEISAITKKTGIKTLGVCFDTCHVYDSGYDIVNKLDPVLDEFDKKVGIKHLKAIHLNDSKNPCGSKKDRHEKIGKGRIKIKCFEEILNNPVLRNLPFILETPNELEGYAEEILILKSLRTPQMRVFGE
ncbi:MAG: deoxyribonuclease IV [Oscillospiraceae bacterium]|jgi:deoxyribonuclease-4|nr:deoxyribonuclease IV [Oscillospiraceae bacterium]